MAKEILVIPERVLKEVIYTIRNGLSISTVSNEVRDQLSDWCDAEEKYLKERDA